MGRQVRAGQRGASGAMVHRGRLADRRVTGAVGRWRAQQLVTLARHFRAPQGVSDVHTGVPVRVVCRRAVAAARSRLSLAGCQRTTSSRRRLPRRRRSRRRRAARPRLPAAPTADRHDQRRARAPATSRSTPRSRSRSPTARVQTSLFKAKKRRRSPGSFNADKTDLDGRRAPRARHDLRRRGRPLPTPRARSTHVEDEVHHRRTSRSTSRPTPASRR